MNAVLRIFILLTLSSQYLLAQEAPVVGSASTPSSPTSPYEEGSEEMRIIRFSDDYIHLQIQNDMKIACKGTLCKLFSVSTSGGGFSAEFNVGFGNNNGGNLGSGGGVVIVPGSGGSGGGYGGGYGGIGGGGPSINLRLSYNRFHCTQTVNVPRSLYLSMNTYLYNLINEDGTPRRGFTPADETMILFYTTIMKQASGCGGGTH